MPTAKRRTQPGRSLAAQEEGTTASETIPSTVVGPPPSPDLDLASDIAAGRYSPSSLVDCFGEPPIDRNPQTYRFTQFVLFTPDPATVVAVPNTTLYLSLQPPLLYSADGGAALRARVEAAAQNVASQLFSASSLV